jgi:hypothetical protein
VRKAHVCSPHIYTFKLRPFLRHTLAFRGCSHRGKVLLLSPKPVLQVVRLCLLWSASTHHTRFALMSWRVGDENVMMCVGGKVANVTTYIIVYCSGERLFSFWINKESWDVFALYFFIYNARCTGKFRTWLFVFLSWFGYLC